MPDAAVASYQLSTNWLNPRKKGQAPIWIARDKGSFVEEDGFTSPTEDFANNLEYFLFDRNILTKTTPSADAWIVKHFGAGFKLRRGNK